MSLAPRVVIVHRRTELQELLDRHATRGQADFFLTSRGRNIDEVEARHVAITEAIATVSAAIPSQWRTGSVERSDLSRFLFAEGDIVAVVGQDGLVANVAKYLDGQVVIGFNPAPERNPGVLVPHPPAAARRLFNTLAAGKATIEQRTMVHALIDDGQRLVALNEIYVGHPSHQTARYTLCSGEVSERQASSGVIAATGTGATGWCRSAWLERRSTIRLPDPTDPTIAWFVREAWPSPATGTNYTEGTADRPNSLTLAVESDHLVAFGDGIESDHLNVTLGQTVKLEVAPARLRVVS